MNLVVVWEATDHLVKTAGANVLLNSFCSQSINKVVILMVYSGCCVIIMGIYN